jgi:hypothetical protein
VDVAIDVAWRRFKEAYVLMTGGDLALRWDQGHYAIRAAGLPLATAWVMFHSLLAVLEEAIARHSPDATHRSQRDRLEWLVTQAPGADQDSIRKLLIQYDRLYGERVIPDEELAVVGEEDRPDFLKMLQRSGRRFAFPFARGFGPTVDAVERLLLHWGLIASKPAYAMSTSVTWHFPPGNGIVVPGPENFGVLHKLINDEGVESTAFTSLPIDQTGTSIDWDQLLTDLEAVVQRWEHYVPGASNRVHIARSGDQSSMWIGPYLEKEIDTIAADLERMVEFRERTPAAHRKLAEIMEARLRAVREKLRELRAQMETPLNSGDNDAGHRV